MGRVEIGIQISCRLLLGGFFLLAGCLKAWNPASFQHEILAYQIMGYPLAFITAHFLPFLEITLGIGVLLKFRPIPALLIILGLLLCFIIALSWTWFSGIDINCGCLGTIDFVEGQPAAILRDLILMLMAGYLLRYSMQKQKIELQ